jgi:RNA polymerase sigma-70 factor (ECF subfamily)
VVTEIIYLYLSALETEDDKIQFEDIYNRYKQQMYSIAYSILNNEADSEDAVHQAFLSLAYNFNKIKTIPCHKLRSYIVIVIRNASINIYNHNKRSAEKSAELDDNISIDINFFENIELNELAEKISNLPPIYKDILYMHYYNGYTQKEISAMLDISYENVRKRMERAKRLLKTELEKDD